MSAASQIFGEPVLLENRRYLDPKLIDEELLLGISPEESN
jgi:hypothetical protein